MKSEQTGPNCNATASLKESFFIVTDCLVYVYSNISCFVYFLRLILKSSNTHSALQDDLGVHKVLGNLPIIYKFIFCRVIIIFSMLLRSFLVAIMKCLRLLLLSCATEHIPELSVRHGAFSALYVTHVTTVLRLACLAAMGVVVVIVRNGQVGLRTLK